MEQATFAAGCFWGIEAAFKKLKGVVKTQVGYSGGHMDNPTYDDVCSDETGHAEVVQVTFEAKKIPYKELLEAFWKMHDPTQMNRQGPDIGTQYRSAIFYHSEKQKKEANESKQALEKSKKYSKPIATLIEPAQKFYKAEEYHQDYLGKNPSRVCHF